VSGAIGGLDLAAAPAHRLAAAIAGGEITARDLAAACLERIAASDRRLHAFVAVYADDALAEAEARDRERAAGAARGALHGVPVALKDLCEIEGRVTTCGSLAWCERVSPLTATVVHRLRAAGMVLLGKTQMVEFAFGGWGTNAHMGTPWNPWDLAVHRVPGGSSSGSAVAVAAGLAPVAIGSDTGGSVRIPAAMCGLVGLKTTVGRISNHGVLPLAETFDTIGPLTRSVTDAALLLAALAGPDPADPATHGLPLDDPLTGIESGVAGLRLGVLAEADREGVDPEVLAAYDAACEVLAGLGATLAAVELPDSFPACLEQTGRIIAAEGYAVHRDWIEDESRPFDPHVRARLLGGKAIGAADYLLAQHQRREVRRRIAAVLGDFAALLTPTTPQAAIPVAEVDEAALPLSRFTRAVNYLDMCALAVPCGLSAAGLPLSLQIIGHGLDEARVLRIGRAYERAVGEPWQRPDLGPLLTG